MNQLKEYSAKVSFGTVRVLDMRRQFERPDVSVIIPVYNASEFIEACVSSAAEQNGVSVEVICVDDGSTDGSTEILFRLAAKYSNLKVICQENSGSPSAPRNVGLDFAHGDYVFFLDADDYLKEDALAGLLNEARKTKNAIVMGKFTSVGGRAVPKQIFTKTTHDADVLIDKAWHNISPTSKLIRRSEIDRLGLRFHEDQWIGEDQNFFAALYLGTEGLSILSDRDYVVIRARDDGGNITSRKQKLSDKAKTAGRLAKVIMEFTAPGEIRDQLAQRIFTLTLPEVINRTYSESSRLERSRFVREIVENVSPVYSERHRTYLPKKVQIGMDLLINGFADDLESFLDHTKEGLSYSVVESELRCDFPRLSEASEKVIDRRFESNNALKLHLTSVSSSSGAFVTCGSVLVRGVRQTPDCARLVLKERSNGSEVEVPCEVKGESLESDGLNLQVEISIPADANINKGAWGTFIELEWGDTIVRDRWGKRTSGIENSPQVLRDETGRDIVLYFNNGYENLTLDIDNSVFSKERVLKLLG